MTTTTDQATLEQILAELRALRDEVSALRAAQSRSADTMSETWEEFVPIAKLAMESGARKLEALEQKGILAFGRELVGVGERVVEAFGPDDVRALGDSIVSILTTVRTWTQPGVMSLAQEAGAAVQSVKQDDKLGVFGMLAAGRDDDVQHGAALVVGVLRRIGKVAKRGQLTSVTPGQPAGWSRLASRLAPTGAVTPPVRRAAASTVPRPTVPRAPVDVGVKVSGGADACEPKVVGPSLPVPAGYDRLPWDAEGYLADAEAWTPALAAALAEQHGITVGDGHMAVLQAARTHFQSAGSAPNVRKLTQVAGISTRDLYALFPDRPGSTVARIAGLKKPVGCI